MHFLSSQMVPSIRNLSTDRVLDNELAEPSGKLTSKTLEVASLSQDEVAQMWVLFSQYYTDVSFEIFVKDLQAKHSIILLLDSGDQNIQGFSTIQVYERETDGKPFIAVYSGDTLIDSRYWGQTALHKAFFLFLMELKLRNPFTTLWWFLICKGYKTYMLLARGCPEYWPRYDRETPGGPKAVMNALAQEKFGGDWQPEDGVIRFKTPTGKLKAGVAPIDESLMSINEIKYFAERNPGHSDGDELVCLGLINARLATYYLKKLVCKKLAAKNVFRSSKGADLNTTSITQGSDS